MRNTTGYTQNLKKKWFKCSSSTNDMSYSVHETSQLHKIYHNIISCFLKAMELQENFYLLYYLSRQDIEFIVRFKIGR